MTDIGGLTKEQMDILRVVEDRALDTFDLASKVGLSPATTFAECCKLKARGLVHWLYPDDAVSPSDAARAALQQSPE